eukprot:GEMP01003745.1.p1 GENE.GEMP01003745.1~~GEMP01003745.1.p1  ORF type:complete len:793 (+),score=223.49 GEMP01003745.1:68-2446(+)
MASVSMDLDDVPSCRKFFSKQSRVIVGEEERTFLTNCMSVDSFLAWNGALSQALDAPYNRRARVWYQLFAPPGAEDDENVGRKRFSDVLASITRAFGEALLRISFQVQASSLSEVKKLKEKLAASETRWKKALSEGAKEAMNMRNSSRKNKDDDNVSYLDTLGYLDEETRALAKSIIDERVAMLVSRGEAGKALKADIKIRELDRALEELKVNYNECEEERSTYESRITMLEREVTNLRQTRESIETAAQLEELPRKLETEEAEKCEPLEDSANTRTELEVKRETMRMSDGTLKMQMKVVHEKCARLKEELDIAADQLAEYAALQANTKLVDEEIKLLGMTVSQLEDTRSDQDMVIERADAGNRDAKDNFERVQKERDAFKQEAETVKEELKTMQAIADKEKADLEKAREETEKVRMDMESASMEAKNASQVGAEMEHIKSEKAKVDAELARLEAENAKMKTENNRLNEENVEVMAEIPLVKSENEKLKSERAQVEHELEQVEREMEQIEFDKVQVEREKDQVVLEKEQLEYDKQHLENELAALRGGGEKTISGDLNEAINESAKLKVPYSELLAKYEKVKNERHDLQSQLAALEENMKETMSLVSKETKQSSQLSRVLRTVSPFVAARHLPWWQRLYDDGRLRMERLARAQEEALNGKTESFHKMMYFMQRTSETQNQAWRYIKDRVGNMLDLIGQANRILPTGTSSLRFLRIPRKQRDKMARKAVGGPRSPLLYSPSHRQESEGPSSPKPRKLCQLPVLDSSKNFGKAIQNHIRLFDPVIVIKKLDVTSP